MIRQTMICAMLLCIAMWVTAASGAPLPIGNSSFEEPVLDPGGWTDVNMDWGDDAGASNDHFTEHIAGFVSDGLNHNGVQNGGVLAQTLADTYQAGMTYTLTVGIGNRNANFTPDNPDLESEIRLLNGTDGSLLATGAYDAFPIGEGNFDDRSLVYVAGAADDGQPIMIELAHASSVGRAHFDNVRLDVVPEPTGLALLSLGAAGFLIRRRRMK